MFRETVAKNLKCARKSNNLTQQEVAYILKTSRSNIAKYENGMLEPNVESIGRLAEIYNVSIDWLFGHNIHE